MPKFRGRTHMYEAKFTVVFKMYSLNILRTLTTTISNGLPLLKVLEAFTSHVNMWRLTFWLADAGSHQMSNHLIGSKKMALFPILSLSTFYYPLSWTIKGRVPTQKVFLSLPSFGSNDDQLPTASCTRPWSHRISRCPRFTMLQTVTLCNFFAKH
jgi:hypothetical protein